MSGFYKRKALEVLKLMPFLESKVPHVITAIWDQGQIYTEKQSKGKKPVDPTRRTN